MTHDPLKVLFSIIACSAGCLLQPGDARDSAAPASAPPAPQASASALVWARAGGVVRTWTIDDEGRALSSEDGIRIAAGGGVWRWAREERSFTLRTCAEILGEEEAGALLIDTTRPAAPGHALEARFDEEGTDHKDVVVKEPEAETIDQAAELDHGAEILGSVGPYVFVRESARTYGCGAHGYTNASFLVWDLERRAPFDWRSAAQGYAREDEARGAMGTDPIEPSVPADPPESVELTMIAPRWSGGGLTLDLQYTADTCFACSDDAWSSYTRSVRLEADAPLPPFAAYASLPPSVARFAADHPDVEIGGFSALSR
jgi:hypothetical protein